MKIIYICHPISGDIEGNLSRISELVRIINLQSTELIPFVPYYADIISLDDTIPDERNRGIANDHEFFVRRIPDEIWVFGAEISTGMKAEIELAKRYGIPVKRAFKMHDNVPPGDNHIIIRDL